MKAVKYILLLLCLYVYLYNPILRLIGFGSIKILLIISFVYLLMNKGFLSLFLNFKTEIIFTIILVFYSFVVTNFGDGTATFVPYQHFTWFLESFIIPLFILYYFKDLFVKYSFESIIIIVGSIASIITLYLIINPSLNTWIRESVIIDALDTTNSEFNIRGFSFAETSSFGYGIIQGLIIAFCLNSIKKSLLYAIPIIPLLISILFNARIGFSVVIISLVLFLVYNRLKFKTLFIGLILVFIVTFIIQDSTIVRENEDSMEWGLGFFNDTFSFISGADTSGSNYDILVNDMLIFPETITGIMFGEGRSAYGLSSKSSDIGYINEILVGGLVYLTIILLFLSYMYIRNLRYTNEKFYAQLFILTFFVVNLKGIALFVPNGFFRLFIMYYIYCILKENFNKELNAD